MNKVLLCPETGQQVAKVDYDATPGATYDERYVFG